MELFGFLRRRRAPARTPIAILSFNRPDYLVQVLDSLKAQPDGLQGREIALFQDGPISPSTGRAQCDPEDCKRNIELFRTRFPHGRVFDSKTNLGIALNIDRAERFVFETLGAEAGMFFEDDMVLSPFYLTVLERLIDLAKADERIGYVAAFGNFQATRDRQLPNIRDVRPLHLL